MPAQCVTDLVFGKYRPRAAYARRGYSQLRRTHAGLGATLRARLQTTQLWRSRGACTT
jgi:hypothetical protein